MYLRGTPSPSSMRVLTLVIHLPSEAASVASSSCGTLKTCLAHAKMSLSNTSAGIRRRLWFAVLTELRQFIDLPNHPPLPEAAHIVVEREQVKGGLHRLHAGPEKHSLFVIQYGMYCTAVCIDTAGNGGFAGQGLGVMPL